jgi:hypothetical protein
MSEIKMEIGSPATTCLLILHELQGPEPPS